MTAPGDQETAEGRGCPACWHTGRRFPFCEPSCLAYHQPCPACAGSTEEKERVTEKNDYGDNPLRRALEAKRKAEGCPEGVPLWSWRRMKREVREAALREALDAILPISERDEMAGAREAWNAVSDLILPPPPSFGTAGAEDSWIKDTEEGAYDEEPPEGGSVTLTPFTLNPGSDELDQGGAQ